jgi:WD40 repeat protein
VRLIDAKPAQEKSPKFTPVCRLGELKLRHPNGITGLVHIPRTNLLISKCGHGVACWDFRTGKEQFFVDVPEIVDIHVHPNSSTLLVSQRNGHITRYSLPKGQKLSSMRLSTGAGLPSQAARTVYATSIRFAVDGQEALIGTSGGWIELWDAELTGRIRKISICDEPRDVAVEPISRELVFVASRIRQEGTEHVWSLVDLTKKKKRSSVSVRCSATTHSIHSGKIAYCYKHRIYVRALDSLKLIMEWELKSTATSLTFSHDGRRLICCTKKSIEVWDLDTRKMSAESADLSDSTAIEALGSDELYAIGEETGRICVWDLRRRKELFPCKGHVGRVQSIAFSPDGRLLASGGIAGEICVWSWQGNSLVYRLIGHKQSVDAVAFDPNNRYLVSTSSDQSVCLWDSKKGKLIRQFQADRGIQSASFSIDGDYVLLGSVGPQHTLYVYELATLKLIFEHPMLVSRAGGFLASKRGSVLGVDFNGHLCEWNYMSKEKSVLSLKRFGFGVVASHRDDVVYFDQNGDLFEHVRGQTSRQRLINDLGFRSVACLSSNAEWLGVCEHSEAIGSEVRVFELSKGKARELEPLRNHRGGVQSLAFSPDNRVFATGGYDSTITVWTLNK